MSAIFHKLTHYIGLLAIVGGTASWFTFSAIAPQEPVAYDGEYEARHGRACLSYGYGEDA